MHPKNKASTLRHVVVFWYFLCRNRPLLSVKLKASLRKFYSRHHELVKRYGTSVSQMTTDMFHLLYTLSGPFLIQDLSPGLLPE